MTRNIEQKREYDRQRYQNNKEAKLEYNRLRQAAMPFERVLWERAKANSYKTNRPFDLTPEDIYVPEYCPVLGMKLERQKGRMSDCSPSLDCIVPELGYVRGNVQVISYLANKMKQNANAEQLLSFADWVYKNFGGN